MTLEDRGQLSLGFGDGWSNFDSLRPLLLLEGRRGLDREMCTATELYHLFHLPVGLYIFTHFGGWGRMGEHGEPDLICFFYAADFAFCQTLRLHHISFPPAFPLAVFFLPAHSGRKNSILRIPSFLSLFFFFHDYDFASAQPWFYLAPPRLACGIIPLLGFVEQIMPEELRACALYERTKTTLNVSTDIQLYAKGRKITAGAKSLASRYALHWCWLQELGEEAWRRGVSGWHCGYLSFCFVSSSICLSRSWKRKSRNL